MQLLKIYDKAFNPLTVLTNVEFNGLSYKKTFQEIGECQFTVRLDRDKVNEANLQHYNRIEIVEDNVIKFVGVIVRKVISIDTAVIRCRELTHVLNKRIMAASYVVNGSIVDKVPELITTVNATDDTGITSGDVLSAGGSVNTTFKRASAFDILTQITKATGNQFRLENDRTLDIMPMIGQDLSDSVIFKYDIDLISASNILLLSVEDNGDEIATRVYGKSGAFVSTQEDSGLTTEFGLLEKYRDFRVVNTQLVLDDFTMVEVAGQLFSPALDLNPSVPDNFDVGDTVRVILKNSLIDIDNAYQVLEKRVQYSGDQKSISVSINALPITLANKLNDRDFRLELLEKQI